MWTNSLCFCPECRGWDVHAKLDRFTIGKWTWYSHNYFTSPPLPFPNAWIETNLSSVTHVSSEILSWCSQNFNRLGAHQVHVLYARVKGPQSCKSTFSDEGPFWILRMQVLQTTVILDEIQKSYSRPLRAVRAKAVLPCAAHSRDFSGFQKHDCRTTAPMSLSQYKA